MITVEEISTRVFTILQKSEVKQLITGVIDYSRHDYTKEDVIIISKGSDGEDNRRLGSIVLNIHVPDLKSGKSTIKYDINFPRLIAIRKAVIAVLQSHYEIGSGYNWTVGRLDPPMQEVGQNEHFLAVYLDITIRNKKQ